MQDRCGIVIAHCKLTALVQFKLQPCTVLRQAFLLMLIVLFAIFHSHLPNHPVALIQSYYSTTLLFSASACELCTVSVMCVSNVLCCVATAGEILPVFLQPLFFSAPVSLPSPLHCKTTTSFIGGKLTAGLWRFSSITVPFPVLCSSASRSTVALQCRLTTRRHKASNSRPWSHQSTVVVYGNWCGAAQH